MCHLQNLPTSDFGLVSYFALIGQMSHLMSGFSLLILQKYCWLFAAKLVYLLPVDNILINFFAKTTLLLNRLSWVGAFGWKYELLSNGKIIENQD